MELELQPKLSSISFSFINEQNDVLSEIEEIQEVKKLRTKGERAFLKGDFQKALKCFDDALEIENQNIEILYSRAACKVQLGLFSNAKSDIEAVIISQPKNPKSHYLNAIIHLKLENYVISLKHFVKALMYGFKNINSLTSSLINLIAQLFNDQIDRQSVWNLANLDIVARLAEIGCILAKSQYTEEAMTVLEIAIGYQSDSDKPAIGIEMKILLALANLKSKARDFNAALELYESCEMIALSCHDEDYQSKALIGLAAILLEFGNIQKAIIAYEKLNDLEIEYDEGISKALHLNLSVAYKAIGLLDKAKYHASYYINLVKDFKTEAKCHLNLGVINELNCDYLEALKEYKMYLKNCSRTPLEISKGYAGLASVYVSLNHHSLALTFLNQIKLILKNVTEVNDRINLLENLGDVYAKLNKMDEAVECFKKMSVMSKNRRNCVVASYKIGKVFSDNKKYQHALFHLEKAADLADGEELSDVRLACDVKCACIMAISGSGSEMNKAKNLLDQIIPILQTKIKHHNVEQSFCPKELINELDACYAAKLKILTKLGSTEEALCTNEYMHPPANIVTGMGYEWTMERIKRTVNLQKSTILCYTINENEFYLWIMKPNEGLVKFFNRRLYESDDANMMKKLTEFIHEIRCDGIDKKYFYGCECRSLPSKNNELDLVCKKMGKLNLNNKAPLSRKSSLISNLASSVGSTSEEFLRREMENSDILIQQTFPLSFSIDGKSTLYENDSNSTKSDEYIGDEKKNSFHLSDIENYAEKQSELILKESIQTLHIEETKKENIKKPVFRELYDLLVSPIIDYLNDSTSLVIITNSILFNIPWPYLQNIKNERLNDRFKITLMPSFAYLERTIYSEMESLAIQDELDWNRNKARNGGLLKILTENAKKRLGDHCNSCMNPFSQANLRQTSNPRLLTSRSSEPIRKLDKTSTPSRETTSMSLPASLLSNKHDFEKRLDRVAGLHTLSTITSKTWTGTDIVVSDVCIPEYVQISCQDRCQVIGAPKFDSDVILYGKVTKLKTFTKPMLDECFRVSEYFGVKSKTGEEATKSMFFHCMRNSTVLHIATVGCTEEGVLIFAPDAELNEKKPVEFSSYTVTFDDISAMSCNSSLVILSSAWSTFRSTTYLECDFKLARAFLNAGAQCVLTFLWPVSNVVLNEFYFAFYCKLMKGCFVSDALKYAIDKISSIDECKEKAKWTPFVLIGKDVFVDLKQIRHHQLDQKIDEAHVFIKEKFNWDPLNPLPPIPNEKNREMIMEDLMLRISMLLVQSVINPNVISEMSALLNGALKRLESVSVNAHTIMLDNILARNVQALLLLRILGFRFQAKNGILTEPFVVFPYNDNDNLILSVNQSLIACIEIQSNQKLCRAIYDYFPTCQENLSHLIDLLAITKHSLNLQLYVTDASVAAVWKRPAARVLLLSLGYHQISSLLHFHATLKYKRLLNATLRLMISLSTQKSPVLLRKLDVSLLGGHRFQKHSSDVDVSLPSLTPLILPRNQIRMATPWLSVLESREEMEEKIKLAFKKNRLEANHNLSLAKAKTWHQSLKNVNKNVSTLKRPKTSSNNDDTTMVVKGSTLSHNRLVIEENNLPLLTIPETEEQRSYAHSVLEERKNMEEDKLRMNTKKLFSQYSINK